MTANCWTPPAPSRRRPARGDEYPDVRAAEALRGWVEEYHLTEDPEADAEDVLSGIASSLLNAALGDVDWLEVARTRLKYDE
jgi:hypothetical protein